jgi:hypothetical protein
MVITRSMTAAKLQTAEEMKSETAEEMKSETAEEMKSETAEEMKSETAEEMQSKNDAYKIEWGIRMTNNSNIHLLEKNMDKIEWDSLSNIYKDSSYDSEKMKKNKDWLLKLGY